MTSYLIQSSRSSKLAQVGFRGPVANMTGRLTTGSPIFNCGHGFVSRGTLKIVFTKKSVFRGRRRCLQNDAAFETKQVIEMNMTCPKPTKNHELGRCGCGSVLHRFICVHVLANCAARGWYRRVDPGRGIVGRAVERLVACLRADGGVHWRMRPILVKAGKAGQRSCGSIQHRPPYACFAHAVPTLVLVARL